MKRFKSIEKLVVLSGIALGIFILVSCQEGDELSTIELSETEQVEIFSNSTEVSNYADEEIDISYQAQFTENTAGRLESYWEECVQITRDTMAKQVTIDFGEGCTGPYGRTRSGRVLITYDGEFNDGLANRVITFEDYFVNARQFLGRIELRNVNRNEEDILTASRSLVDFTVVYPNGNSMVINGSTTRAWLEGEGDGDPSTNVIQLTGSYEGVSTKGRSFSHEIVEPVIADFGCRLSGGFLRTEGVIEMTLSGIRRERVRTVDYGDGSCDSEYSVTINDEVTTVTTEG